MTNCCWAVRVKICLRGRISVTCWMYMGGGFGVVAGPDGVGGTTLSSMGRGSKRFEVVVVGDTWWVSLTYLAARTEGCLGDRLRLYETVVQGGGEGWVEDMGWGWAGVLPARGWDEGSRIGLLGVVTGSNRN
jgi:hypothetical protein